VGRVRRGGGGGGGSRTWRALISPESARVHSNTSSYSCTRVSPSTDTVRRIDSEASHVVGAGADDSLLVTTSSAVPPAGKERERSVASVRGS
jgi:hypothetical protein